MLFSCRQWHGQGQVVVRESHGTQDSRNIQVAAAVVMPLLHALASVVCYMSSKRMKGNRVPPRAYAIIRLHLHLLVYRASNRTDLASKVAAVPTLDLPRSDAVGVRNAVRLAGPVAAPRRLDGRRLVSQRC